MYVHFVAQRKHEKVYKPFVFDLVGGVYDANLIELDKWLL